MVSKCSYSEDVSVGDTSMSSNNGYVSLGMCMCVVTQRVGEDRRGRVKAFGYGTTCMCTCPLSPLPWDHTYIVSRLSLAN